MPSKRKRGSARRSGAAATAIVVLVVLAVGYLAIKHRAATVRPTACLAGSPNALLQLSVSQAGIAATIAGVASQRAMPGRAVAIAYAAALQESKLSNLPYGDRDSVGVFQQRPSEGWGTRQEIEDPVYASGRFFAALAGVPHYLRLPIYRAAQAVQHSADGSAYGQYALMGTQLARAFTGTVPHSVWCSYGAPVGKARLAAAIRALSTAFGSLPHQAAMDPAASVTVSSARQGWAVAAWLVSHAANYGIAYVRFGGYQWHAMTGPEHWVRQQAQAGKPAGTAVVVFG